MPTSSLHTFDLQCHVASPCPAVRRLQVHLSRAGGRQLSLRYVLEADLSRLRIPPAAAPERTDELWRHTCFEAFLGAGDSPAYYEVNLAPSSRWALYRFDSYRQGMQPVLAARTPAIGLTHAPQQLELDAVLSLDDLADLRSSASLRIALSAVVEARDGGLSYWALRHPAGKPDFHHAAGFQSLDAGRP